MSCHCGHRNSCGASLRFSFPGCPLTEQLHCILLFIVSSWWRMPSPGSHMLNTQTTSWGQMCAGHLPELSQTLPRVQDECPYTERSALRALNSCFIISLLAFICTIIEIILRQSILFENLGLCDAHFSLQKIRSVLKDLSGCAVTGRKTLGLASQAHPPTKVERNVLQL